MFFSGIEPIVRTLLIGFLAYIGLILVLRISGKRTLTKMNAFDLVVTVAIGSTLATILLSKEVALAEGLTAFILLIGMQYIITWLSVRSDFFSSMIKSTPELLYYNEGFIKKVMKKERILEKEVLQAARSSGIKSMNEVEAVVLETDGRISVIKRAEEKEDSTLMDLKEE